MVVCGHVDDEVTQLPPHVEGRVCRDHHDVGRRDGVALRADRELAGTLQNLDQAIAHRRLRSTVVSVESNHACACEG